MPVFYFMADIFMKNKIRIAYNKNSLCKILKTGYNGKNIQLIKDFAGLIIKLQEKQVKKEENMAFNKFSVLDFGAEANTDKNQSENIQRAVDACFKSGGGYVIIPEGDYIIGDIRIRSNVYIHLLKNAHLIGSKNPEDYFNYLNDETEPLGKEYITEKLWEPPGAPNRDYTFMRTVGSRWNNGIIRGIFAENCGVIGEEGSYIDGRNCYDEKNEEEYRGPHALSFWYCKNVRFEGYTVKNSGNWAHNLHYCENVFANKITVLAGHDGFHTKVCRNVSIENCGFYTGDDCLAGFANVNYYVKNCVLNSACNAMRLGATNAVIEKSKIYGPCKYCFRKGLTREEKMSGKADAGKNARKNMLSAFTYYSDIAFPIDTKPGNIIVRDCSIDFADRLFLYNYSAGETWQRGAPLLSFEFDSIKAENISMPLVCCGSEDEKIDFTLKNSSVSFRKGFEKTDFMHINNFGRITFKNVEIKNNTSNPSIISRQDKNDIEFDNVVSQYHKNGITVRKTEEKFVCESI